MNKLPLVLAFVLTAPMAFADSGPDATALFKSNCAICHGADGAGQTPVGKSMKVRDLRSAEVQQQSDAELAHTIAGGKGKMPAYKSKLGTEEIQALVGLIRTLRK